MTDYCKWTFQLESTTFPETQSLFTHEHVARPLNWETIISLRSSNHCRNPPTHSLGSDLRSVQVLGRSMLEVTLSLYTQWPCHPLLFHHNYPLNWIFQYLHVSFLALLANVQDQSAIHCALPAAHRPRGMICEWHWNDASDAGRSHYNGKYFMYRLNLYDTHSNYI